jgi:formamidopyrimidine-DNA glycosylase
LEYVYGFGGARDKHTVPELPEVETTRRGIEPYLKDQIIKTVTIRNAHLRWPIPKVIEQKLLGKKIHSVKRRAKYLLIKTTAGTLILHLGMSGSLRISTQKTAFRKHDHFALTLSNNKDMRLHDPRRFGAVLWTNDDALQHPLLISLGPEPLEEAFNSDYLYRINQNRKVSIKQHIMNSKIVVGVSNIYASESLFLAGIHPKRAAGKISAPRIEKLVESIKSVLTDSILQGGTTLRDFVRENGEPGYFSQRLNVYGKAGDPCPHCGKTIKQIVLGQRSTYYCPKCQH